MPIVGQFGSLAGLGPLILPGGAMESIATVTVGSGGASSITFSDIPGGFQHLQVRLLAKAATDSGGGVLSFNLDTTYTNYRSHRIFGDGGSASATSLQDTIWQGCYSILTRNVGAIGASVIDILDYGNTSKNTVVRTFSGSDDNGSGYIMVASGLWLNTAAVTSITLTPYNYTFAQYSTAALYGVRA